MSIWQEIEKASKPPPVKRTYKTVIKKDARGLSFKALQRTDEAWKPLTQEPRAKEKITRHGSEAKPLPYWVHPNL